MDAVLQPVKKKPVVTAYGVAALLIFLAFALSFGWSSGRLPAAKRAKLANEFSQVQAAVLGYYTEYSEYPSAPNDATLITELMGDNPRKVEFLALHSSDLNANGELVDPWGTPLQLSIDADGTLHARSAGPDRIFGTPDDIVGKFEAPR